MRPRSTLARTDSGPSTDDNSLGGGGGLNTVFLGTGDNCNNISMDGSVVLDADDGRGSCDSVLGGGYGVLDRGSAQGGCITDVGVGDDGGDLPARGSNGARGADGNDSVVELNGGFLGAHSGRPPRKLVGGLLGSLSGSNPTARVRGAVQGTSGRTMARGFDALGVGILGGMGDDRDMGGGALLRVPSAYGSDNGLDNADNVLSATRQRLGHTVLLQRQRLRGAPAQRRNAAWPGD
jgi:hypothetical protein